MEKTKLLGALVCKSMVADALRPKLRELFEEVKLELDANNELDEAQFTFWEEAGMPTFSVEIRED